LHGDNDEPVVNPIIVSSMHANRAQLAKKKEQEAIPKSGGKERVV